MKRKLFGLLAVVIVASMLLTACAPAAAPTTAPAQPTQAPAAEQPTAAPEQPTQAAPAEQPTGAPAAPAAPATSRMGGWLDKIVFSKIEDPEPAVAQLQAGAVDMYAVAVPDPKVYDKVKADANLKSVETYGSNDQMILNTVACKDTNVLNPFTDMKIREAMNWALDRNYVAQEISGGLAKPKYTALTTAFADYSRYADVMSAIETKYAYNLDKAQQVVDTEMKALGAEKGADGKWMYKGKPVTIIGLIRTEDSRKEIGNYFANQLEKLGFTVDRQEKTRKEAGPIWQGSDLDACKFSFYTAGWIATAISRDDGNMFVQYNTGKMQNIPLFNEYKPSAKLQEVEDKLFTNNFANMDERAQLFKDALTMSMEESWWGLWVVDLTSFSPYSKNVEGAYDLAGGFASAQMLPYTLRFTGKEGGEMKIAQSNVLVQPWNPVAGSNWTDDAMPKYLTEDWGLMYDPYTGLSTPKLVQKADLVVQEGLPVNKSSDWVTLSTAKQIAVPDDAWASWDPTAQKFITVAEAKAAKPQVDAVKAKATELAGAVDLTKVNDAAVTKLVTDLGDFFNTTLGTKVDFAAAVATEDNKKAFTDEATSVAAMKTDDEKKTELSTYALNFVSGMDTSGKYALGSVDYSSAKTKSTVVYKPELWKETWHDGSPMSIGDFVMYMIMTFDPGMPGSKVYNDSLKSGVDTFLTHFKGVKITSTDPLTIETYDDQFALDAELTVSDWWPGRYAPAAFSGGQFAWHDLAPMVLAEQDGKIALTTEKAQTNKVEWSSLIAGPSLDIQKQYLDKAAADKTLPYAPTMSQFVKEDEIAARYANLQKWYDAHKHLYLGTGPYYVDQVFPVEGNITLAHYDAYQFPADLFANFAAPKLSTAAVDGPTAVTIGQEASFDVTVTFNDEPYASADIAKVSYILFDAQNNVVSTGEAKMAEEGKYQVVLPADVTSKLQEGPSKINVVVSSKVVSIPTFQTYEFVVTK